MVPSATGDYLLVIDVWSPTYGALSAQPGRPTVIKVHVGVAAGGTLLPAPLGGAVPGAVPLDP